MNDMLLDYMIFYYVLVFISKNGLHNNCVLMNDIIVYYVYYDQYPGTIW